MQFLKLFSTGFFVCATLTACASPNNTTQSRSFAATDVVSHYDYPYSNGMIWQNISLQPEQVTSVYSQCKKQQETAVNNAKNTQPGFTGSIAGAVVVGLVSGAVKASAPKIGQKKLQKCMTRYGFQPVAISQRMVGELDSLPVEERNAQLELMMSGKL